MRAAATAVLVLVAGAVVTLSGPVQERVASWSASVTGTLPGSGGEVAADALPRNAFYLGSGVYRTSTAEVSDQMGSEQGRLVRLSKSGSAGSFLIAYDSDVDTQALPLRAGWTAEEVGHDPMWMPEACAQRPSWLIGGRYLLISDAQYAGFEVIDRYLVYDLERRTFTYFSVPETTEGSAAAKVLAVAVESDTFVLYLDVHDPDGPYSSDPAYRHATSHHNGFLVRRVVSPQDLSYADYKVPFESPPVEDYTLRIFGQAPALFLGVTQDDGSTVPMGVDDASSATLAIAPLEAGELKFSPGQHNPPEDAAAQQARTAVVAAVQADPQPALTAATDIDARVVGQGQDVMYLRVGPRSATASLPAEFDRRSGQTAFPLSDDFQSAGFVVAAAP